MTKVTLRHLFLRDRMLMSRFGLVIDSMLWATWHQVFRYPRGDK